MPSRDHDSSEVQGHISNEEGLPGNNPVCETVANVSSGYNAPPAISKINNDWLRDFYKECGREVTLAYTTLNQMKNWAIVVLLPIIAALFSAGGGSRVPEPPTSTPKITVAIVLGATFSYVFTLRFFVRAILCYINLLRWNKLQAGILRYTLCETSPDRNDSAEQRLIQLVEEYYHRWRSPVARPQQVASNLKLGFGLVMSVPLTLICWGGYVHWHDLLVRGFVVFAAGATLIELIDFLYSPLFDTPAVAKRRRVSESVFPGPTGSVRYVLTWLLNLIVSTLVAFWPKITTCLCQPF